MTEPTRQPRKTAAKKTAPAPPEESHDYQPIRESQMRHLHGLLRSRLGLHERDDVLDYLSVALGRDVTTRRSLSSDEAEGLFGLLTPLPPSPATPADLAALRAPFPEEAIGKLPRSTCRACSQSSRKRCEDHGWLMNCPECHGKHSTATMHIDFVGHADVTARLLAVDPYWTWEPMATDPGGMPLLDRSNGLWIRLTVCGITRPGYGDAENGKGMKEAIGDALRNAAMRFGIALDLWAKGDREWAHAEKWDATTIHPDEAAPAEQQAPREWSGPSRASSLDKIDKAAESLGMTREQVTVRWRASRGDMPVVALLDADPESLFLLAEQVTAHAATLRAADEAAAAEAVTGDGDVAPEADQPNPWA